MKIKFYLSELFFLGLIPLLITGIITFFVLKLTASAGSGYFIFVFPWLLVIIPLYIFIAFFVNKFQNKKYNFWRVVILTVLLILIYFFVSSIIHRNNRKADLEEQSDMGISQQAIYTNDKSLCDNLRSRYGEACRLGFQRSYKLCQQSFADKEDSDYFNACIINVLHLTNDLKGCEAVQKKPELKLCSWSYNAKYTVYGILSEDKSVCDKIIDPTMKKECVNKIERVLESKAKYGEDSFIPDFYMYIHSNFRYDINELYKNGKIIFQ